MKKRNCIIISSTSQKVDVIVEHRFDGAPRLQCGLLIPSCEVVVFIGYGIHFNINLLSVSVSDALFPVPPGISGNRTPGHVLKEFVCYFMISKKPRGHFRA